MYAAIGFSYINLNHIPQAIPPLQRAAKLLPRDYLVQSQLGFCLQQTGDVDMGISLLRKGISLKSSYGPAWEHLGLAYQRKADHKHAVEAFEKATQLMPSSRNPWQHLADGVTARWVVQPMRIELLRVHNNSAARPQSPKRKRKVVIRARLGNREIPSGSLKRFDKCAASAFTPKVSVA